MSSYLSRNLIRDYRSLASSSGLCTRCIATTITPRSRKSSQKPSVHRNASSLFSPPPAADKVKSSQKAETHYDFFPKTLADGPPPHGKFHIDIVKLREEFLQLQAAAHPDRHQGANKTRAEAVSAAINDAYRTLCEPLLRAQYLLMLQGKDVANDETAKEQDMGLLEEILDAREQIESAQEEADLKTLDEANRHRIKFTEKALGKALEQGKVEQAIDEVRRLRYWINIRETLQDWEKGKPVVLIH